MTDTAAGVPMDFGAEPEEVSDGDGSRPAGVLPNSAAAPAQSLVALRPSVRRTRPPTPPVERAAEALLVAAGLGHAPSPVVTVMAQDGRSLHLSGDRTVLVGRSDADADLVIADGEVSRQHCRLALDERSRVTVEDLASANGTWIHRGDRRIDIEPGRPVVLEDGDWLRSGDHAVLVHVRFDQEERP